MSDNKNPVKPVLETYEVIYQNRIIGHVNFIPIVGDDALGHIVWEVDYHHRYAYVTD